MCVLAIILIIILCRLESKNHIFHQKKKERMLFFKSHYSILNLVNRNKKKFKLEMIWKAKFHGKRSITQSCKKSTSPIVFFRQFKGLKTRQSKSKSINMQMILHSRRYKSLWKDWLTQSPTLP